jgi:hypothetical protein
MSSSSVKDALIILWVFMPNLHSHVNLLFVALHYHRRFWGVIVLDILRNFDTVYVNQQLSQNRDKDFSRF